MWSRQEVLLNKHVPYTRKLLSTFFPSLASIAGETIAAVDLFLNDELSISKLNGVFRLSNIELGDYVI